MGSLSIMIGNFLWGFFERELRRKMAKEKGTGIYNWVSIITALIVLSMSVYAIAVKYLDEKYHYEYFAEKTLIDFPTILICIYLIAAILFIISIFQNKSTSKTILALKILVVIFVFFATPTVIKHSSRVYHIKAGIKLFVDPDYPFER